MSDPVQAFLFDTLLWTGVLIAGVLLLRRPVARHFGAEAAYALWFIPLLRLVMPPIELPAWLKPSEPVAEALPPVPADAAALPVGMPEEAAYQSLSAIATEPGLFEGVDFVTPLLAVWLLGVVVFLARRIQLYHEMRREMLADARPVGRFGTIRLVETRILSGPVAFGVRDKVVALPWGFMASPDRARRDLALAHELAHHRGHDLLVNFLVQPLFALHWFSPLGWAGWRALRRDQEAACDARVVASRSRAERATYAGLIADFACRTPAMPRAALAAPMACPVLGDKSIIHRLRNLTMADLSPRRRFAGHLLLGAALLSVPLTATVAYADPPLAPEALEAPEPPLPPDAPEAPGAPLPPEAVEPPALDDGELVTSGTGDSRRTVWVRRETGPDGREHVTRRVITGKARMMSAEDRAEFEADMAELQRELAENQRDIDEDLAEMERDLAEAMREEGEARAEARRAVAHARAYADGAARAAAKARAAAPEVVHDCRYPKSPATSVRLADGRTRLYICKSAGEAIRREALREARSDIEADEGLPAKEKAKILRDLDRDMRDGEKVSQLVPISLTVGADEDCPEEKAKARARALSVTA